MNTSLIRATESKTRSNVYLFGNPTISQLIGNYRNIIKDYPQWEVSLFDEYFFTAKVAPMIKHSQKNNLPVNAKEITLAWADQVNLNEDSRNELMSELKPIVEKILVAVS